jgi:hypothetical protein
VFDVNSCSFRFVPLRFSYQPSRETLLCVPEGRPKTPLKRVLDVLQFFAKLCSRLLFTQSEREIRSGELFAQAIVYEEVL